jgi:hypothetical protein
MANSVPARPRPLKASPVFWVGPTREAARLAARRRARGSGARVFSSLAEFLRGEPREPARVVFCPAGRRLEADLAFLKAASLRVLWPPAPWILREAIAGLLNLPESDAASGPARRPPRSAVLLEGPVDWPRASRVLAARGPRLWILEDPRLARFSLRRFEELSKRGVQFACLRPVRIEAVAASAALAASRKRWGRWLPAQTPAVLPAAASGALRAPVERPRRSSRR